MVRKPVKSFQVSAARYLPFGLIEDDSSRPLFTSRRCPSGVMRWLVGSRMPLPLLLRPSGPDVAGDRGDAPPRRGERAGNRRRARRKCADALPPPC